jgi:hypothetical protein
MGNPGLSNIYDSTEGYAAFFPRQTLLQLLLVPLSVEGPGLEATPE